MDKLSQKIIAQLETEPTLTLPAPEANPVAFVALLLDYPIATTIGGLLVAGCIGFCVASLLREADR